MLTTHEQHSRAKLLATVLSVLVVAGVVMIADHLKSKTPAAGTFSPTTAVTTSPGTSSQSSGTSSTGTTSSNSGSTSSNGGYNDGTYTAASNYFVPSGEQSIAVNLTLKGGVISSASVQNSESDPTSAQFQQDFASQYKSYVVGQKLSSLQLSVIAGASDTTQGFATALSQIANKAKA